MLLVLWQLFLFRVCGNTTPKIAGQLRDISKQCFLWFCLATVQHSPCTPKLEVTKQKPAEPAFCTSFMLIFHIAIIKKRSFNVATWRINSNKPTTSHSFHLASGKSLPVWTDAISTCPRCAVLVFSTYSTLLLKRTNRLLQPECSPDGKRWLNVKPEQFPIQIPKHKSTFKRCLQHNWHCTIIFVKSVSAIRTVLGGDVEQSYPLLVMCVQTCSSEVQPKPKTLAESHLRSPIQAQNRLNH